MNLLHRSRPRPVVAFVPAQNVRLLPDLPLPSAAPDGSGAFLVRDGSGNILDTGVVTRQEALRRLGTFAIRGVSAPLILLTPDGEPTGDRIG